MSHDALLVLSTCPDQETAEIIGRALVEKRLVACANILPGITSLYRWRETLERTTEVLLLLKSRQSAYAALEAEVKRLHPYELPEIVAVSLAGGLADYLAWINTEVVAE